MLERKVNNKSLHRPGTTSWLLMINAKNNPKFLFCTLASFTEQRIHSTLGSYDFMDFFTDEIVPKKKLSIPTADRTVPISFLQI